MHHKIVIKAKGDTANKAKEQVETALSDTLRCGQCERSVKEVNWDYVGDITLIDKKLIDKFSVEDNGDTIESLVWRKGTTPESIARSYIDLRKPTLKELIKRFENEVLKRVSAALLTKEEIPLHLKEVTFSKSDEDPLQLEIAKDLTEVFTERVDTM